MPKHLLGVRVDECLARTVDLPPQPLVLGQSLHIGDISITKNDALFKSAHHNRRVEQLIFFDQQRLAEEGADVTGGNTWNGFMLAALHLHSG